MILRYIKYVFVAVLSFRRPLTAQNAKRVSLRQSAMCNMTYSC